MKQKKTKRLIQFGALIFFGALLLSGCNIKDRAMTNNNVQPETVMTERIKVAATIFPVYDLVREIGGEKVDPILILPPGASPHTFEITPQKVKDLMGSELLFVIGKKLDDWAVNSVEVTSGTKLVDLSTVVELRAYAENLKEDKLKHEGETEKDDGHGHEPGDLDPHYWLSPKQAKSMANKIAAELGAIDTVNADYYLANAQSFNQLIDEKIIVWQAKLNNLENRNIVVFHDAWGYFASDFNLNVVATFEPFPGKSPSPKYIEAIINKTREYQIKTLFIEPQLAVDAAQTLAQDLDLEIRVLDPIGGLYERNSYISLIDYNVNEIAR